MIYGYSKRKRRIEIESWQNLVHVCQRWRDLVFGSPRSLRLKLQIYCRPSRVTKKSLDVWPPFPVLVNGNVTKELVDNVIPGLEHRISQINLRFDEITPQIEKLWTQMQASFPELAALHLSSTAGFLSFAPPVPPLPDSFLLGGSASAPHLRYLELTGIPFPGLPKLLLSASATRLVKLYLRYVPPSGFVSHPRRWPLVSPL